MKVKVSIGDGPLVLAQPHGGVEIPQSILNRLNPRAEPILFIFSPSCAENEGLPTGMKKKFPTLTLKVKFSKIGNLKFLKT